MALYVWGSDSSGELGLGKTELEPKNLVNCPQKMQWEESGNLKQAALGGQHTLLLTTNGKVYSCGNNDYGQLGQDISRKRPQLISSLENYNITQISCGFQHSMAINEWGQLFVWGSNSSGQCGLENDSSAIYPTPKLVKSLATKQIVQIACGQFHSLALTNSGELYSFGSNLLGQLGLGFESEKVVKPTLVKSLAGVPIAFLSCGGNHSFVVSKSGAVFGWGKNLYGQLGVNDQVSKNFPTQLRTLRSIGVRYIACGDDFSVFLTQDGGVFTCGAGAFGQLGHGNYSNEILPRMVMELMGSTVTQIVCGRRHTLTYVPSRKRVYGFGLGGSGQLGSDKDCTNSSVPQTVHGPWVTTTSIVDSCDLRVKSIFAGGDHCLVSLLNLPSLIESEDYRDYMHHNQIWSMSKDLTESCAKVKNEEGVDMELITAVEVVFKNLACFNASFLLDNNGHFYCTSKHHGINLKYAEEAFDFVRKIDHDNLKTLIWDSITNDLLLSLSTSPPDVETLRIFMILPLYHEFVNSKNYNKLHTPFCKVMLNLDKIPLKIISGWYSMTTSDYFERLVDVFKDVVKYFLHFELSKIQMQSNKQVMFHNDFFIVLNMLSLLYHVNHQQRQEAAKVPYEVFHVPEITDYFEIRQDYISWCADMNPNSFYLCNYPFLFDASAKHLLLQTDQALQMHNAMQTAAASSIFTQFFGAPANIYIVLNVTRENIVEDTIRELTQYSSADLMKPLKVKFAGEEAEDAGGVRKEFFMLLLKDVLDAKYGMFKYYEETRSIWFAEDSFESEEIFKLVGILCGLAIYNFTIINISFPLALYKKLLNEKPALSDLKELSPPLAQSMQSILDYDGDDMADVFGLSFEVSRTFFGENRVFELKPNGSNISVTQENKKEFVDLYIDFVFNKSVEKQYKGFHEGFMKVCGGRVMKLFKPHELMAVVVGNEDYNWDEFESNAEYKSGYTSSDISVRMFWEVFHELSLEDKKKFLLFLTGSDRIPIQGMKGIKIFIQPVNDDNLLCVAHTCFNLLDLPRYKSKGKLKYKLLQSIQMTQGFSLV